MTRDLYETERECSDESCSLQLGLLFDKKFLKLSASRKMKNRKIPGSSRVNLIPLEGVWTAKKLPDTYPHILHVSPKFPNFSNLRVEDVPLSLVILLQQAKRELLVKKQIELHSVKFRQILYKFYDTTKRIIFTQYRILNNKFKK